MRIGVIKGSVNRSRGSVKLLCAIIVVMDVDVEVEVVQCSVKGKKGVQWYKKCER